jgi:hypothetical protein
MRTRDFRFATSVDSTPIVHIIINPSMPPGHRRLVTPVYRQDISLPTIGRAPCQIAPSGQ